MPRKPRNQLTGLPSGPTSYDPMSGTGFMDVIRKVGSTVSKTNNFLKNSKIISKSARAVAHVTGNKAVSSFADQADALGYGRMPIIVVKKKQGRPRKVGRPKKH